MRPNSESPTSYVVGLGEVKKHAVEYSNKSGKVAYWLPWKFYTSPEFKDAWDRMGQAQAPEPD